MAGEALALRSATCLTPLGKTDDEFCSQQCRVAW